MKENTKGREGNIIFEGMFQANYLHTCEKIGKDYVAARLNYNHYKKTNSCVTSQRRRNEEELTINFLQVPTRVSSVEAKIAVQKKKAEILRKGQKLKVLE